LYLKLWRLIINKSVVAELDVLKGIMPDIL